MQEQFDFFGAGPPREPTKLTKRTVVVRRHTRSLTRAEQGAAARDAGIARAERGANAAVAQWSKLAMLSLTTFMRHRGVGFKFQLADFRAAGGALADPPEPRAWGAIINRASRAGLIERHGFEPCNDPRQHRCPTSVWRVVRVE